MNQKLAFQERDDAICNIAAQMHEKRENLFDHEYVSIKYWRRLTSNWKCMIKVR